MSTTLTILMFFVIANLPWLTERVFFVGPLHTPKPVLLRLVEWLFLYFISLFIALAMEYRYLGGAPHPKDWEFYVITLCLFLVLAVPGVIYRHQWLPMQNKRSQ